MDELPLAVIPLIDLRPASCLSQELILDLVGHEVLGGNPTNLPFHFNLYVLGEQRQFLYLSEILLQGVLESLEV